MGKVYNFNSLPHSEGALEGMETNYTFVSNISGVWLNQSVSYK